jgi:hypothetical protein
MQKTEIATDSLEISQIDPAHWSELYKAAMFETDPVHASQHIEAALRAIAQRSSEWKQARTGNMDIEELHEIAEAASSLRYWKKFISTYSV